MQWVPFAGFPFVLLFGASLAFAPVQRLLSQRWLLLVGFVSYPLYLLHEQAIVGLTMPLSRGVRPGRLAGAIPLIPIALIITASWVVAKFWERPVRNGILWMTRLSIRAARGRRVVAIPAG